MNVALVVAGTLMSFIGVIYLVRVLRATREPASPLLVISRRAFLSLTFVGRLFCSVVFVIGIGMVMLGLLGSREPEGDPADVASRFLAAVVIGDREDALALVAPTPAAESRSATLVATMDWARAHGVSIVRIEATGEGTFVAVLSGYDPEVGDVSAQLSATVEDVDDEWRVVGWGWSSKGSPPPSPPVASGVAGD